MVVSQVVEGDGGGSAEDVDVESAKATVETRTREAEVVQARDERLKAFMYVGV